MENISSNTWPEEIQETQQTIKAIATLFVCVPELEVKTVSQKPLHTSEQRLG